MPALKYAVGPTLAVAFLLALAGCGGQVTPPAAGVGDACTDSAACGAGLICETTAAYPGGYCTSDCTTAACPTGSVCAPTTPALCVATCATDTDCRAGYQCWEGACRPRCDVDPSVCGADAVCVAGACAASGCATNADCAVGELCVDSVCVPDTSGDAGMPLGVGQPCTSDAQCESEICTSATRGGFCSIACTSRDDCVGLIPGTATGCGPVPSDSGGVRTACIPRIAGGGTIALACTSDGDCAGNTCVAGQCTEACVDDDTCVFGQICTGDVAWGGGTFQGCGYEAGTGVEEIDLGTRVIAAGSGVTLELALPPDAVSVTLRARRVDGDELAIGFLDVENPRAETIYDLNEIVEWRDTPERWLPSGDEEAIAMLVPNATTERLPWVPGLHRFSVFAWARYEGDRGEADVEISALIKRAPAGVVSAGTIDVDVFLVGVGLTATSAPSDARLATALGRFRTLLSQAQLTVGDVAFHEVTGADATTFQIVSNVDDADSELPGLFRLTSPTVTGRRLALFVVRSIETDSDRFNTLGIAGGIPGPSGLYGTAHSGVVVAYEGIDGNSLGQVMAHEVSHFLGLWHVTERAPACAPGVEPTTCAPFGGTDTIGDTTRGDTGNLMHWELRPGSSTDISTGQKYVLLRSALAR